MRSSSIAVRKGLLATRMSHRGRRHILEYQRESSCPDASRSRRAPAMIAAAGSVTTTKGHGPRGPLETRSYPCSAALPRVPLPMYQPTGPFPSHYSRMYGHRERREHGTVVAKMWQSNSPCVCGILSAHTHSGGSGTLHGLISAYRRDDREPARDTASTSGDAADCSSG